MTRFLPPQRVRSQSLRLWPTTSPYPQTSPCKILIVGGGIGGMVAAVALRQRDFDVEIVEVNPRWDVYGVGIIQLANALRALASVGLADQALAAGFGMNTLSFYDHEGHLLYTIPQPQLAGPHYPAANALTRSRLHKLLQGAVRKVGAPVRVGVTVSELQQKDDAVEVTFTDQTSGRYDLVIGADGLRSLIRSPVTRGRCAGATTSRDPPRWIISSCSLAPAATRRGSSPWHPT